jgi:hypothetical protein
MKKLSKTSLLFRGFLFPNPPQKKKTHKEPLQHPRTKTRQKKFSLKKFLKWSFSASKQQQQRQYPKQRNNNDQQKQQICYHRKDRKTEQTTFTAAAATEAL